MVTTHTNPMLCGSVWRYVFVRRHELFAVIRDPKMVHHCVQGDPLVRVWFKKSVQKVFSSG